MKINQNNFVLKWRIECQEQVRKYLKALKVDENYKK